MTSKLDPWGKGDIEDYRSLFTNFGIEPFEKYKKKFIDNRYIRRGIIFGQRDFTRIIEAIEKNKDYAMMTGLMPSGKFHFGHKIVADQIIWYQNLGADIFLCSADLEASIVRNIDLQEAKKTAVEEYLTNYVALGLTEKNLTFWFQTDYKKPYHKLRDQLPKKVTINELKAIYGEDLTTAKIFSAITQAADILHTQLKEFGGPRPVVVPVGADQDPHIRLTRDLAARFNTEYGFIPPSSTYHKFMRGLSGGKMSSSDPASHIALTESPESAQRKIMTAKTGGRATAAEQKEKGGVPEECVVYEMLLYHLIEDDKQLEEIYQSCKTGKRICGECKKHCAEMLTDFLKKHAEKRKKAHKKVEEILSNSGYQ